ncbi:GNAT family N-acetyltransferase [Prauserella marina]|uniref:Predicted acetyltransferase, GNAT superfamily n=1 Tax=Prauserella marina TaxID=530584 RepID=A0A222VSA8_9PSEU|nr:GNAT family N-acetyltransferase [Prauserella marina]ASR36732.1 GNAT family N-acetyltransferase [Prauserella marina]PWV80388.1 putative GNAT superfamily acetyltransferase [Prauserella marina]SDD53245.1 Predicted acetyltransferase, GNAT superfamily [Prauserella marina]
MTITLRQALTSDHPVMVGSVQRWWGDSRTPEQARELSLLLPKLFLQHFAGTSLVALAEDDDGTETVAGFLVGFHSADQPDVAYIHFVGVDPQRRGLGIARTLYRQFFAAAERAGKLVVHAVTSPGNTGSIAFHRALGFRLLPGDRTVDNADDTGNTDDVTVHSDYDGEGQDRVCFELALGSPGDR